MPNAVPILEAGDRLGECPVWAAAESCLYWLDCLEPRLHRLHPGSGGHRVLPLPLRPPLGALLATSEPGTLLLAAREGVSLLDAASGALRPLLHPIADLPHLGYNDAKTDRRGRLWLGTLDLAERDPRALLFRVEGGRAHVADAGFVVCNGPAFSPAGDVLYFSDSLAGRVLAYDVEPDTGALANRRALAEFAGAAGLPDGLTVDAAGAIWVAHWAGGRVTRLSPAGETLAVVDLPAPNVTSCAFGGPDLRTLFVTTAREGLAPEALLAAPLAGALFAIETDVPGLTETPWVPPHP